MAIEISAPVAGVGGGVLLAGGGAVAVASKRQLAASTSLAQFAVLDEIIPTLKEFEKTLGYADTVLTGVQDAMTAVRTPGTGMLRRVPLLGSAADDLERAARLGAAAHELSKIDETALAKAATKLKGSTTGLIASAEAGVTQFRAARISAGSASTKLLVGGGVALAGALLLATAVFDVG